MFWNRYPYSDYHQLNLDWLLEKVKELNSYVLDLGKNIHDDVADILTEWLNDGTLAFIISNDVLKALKQFYIPEEFGAVGDGISDDTDAFDAACAAMATGDIKILFIPPKTYCLDYTIGIPEGCTVIGTGRKSCIMYTEGHTNFGVALTNAGSGVTIKNLRLEQTRSGSITLGAQTGCISFSTLNNTMYGKVTAPYNRTDTHDLRVENVVTDDSPYLMQTETAEGYTISNVVARNLRAPKGLISWMSHINGGSIKNIHYDDIEAAYIRCDDSGNDVTNGVISNFKTQGLKMATAGQIAENGVIDASGSTLYTFYGYAAQLKAGSILKNVHMIGGGSNQAFAFGLLAQSDQVYTLEGCRIEGFDKFSQNLGNPAPAVSQPFYMTDCYVDWTDAGHVPMIQGYATNVYWPSINMRSPLYFNQSRDFPDASNALSIKGTDVSDRFPVKLYALNDRMYLECYKTLPANGKIAVVSSSNPDFTKYIGASGISIPVMLLKADGTFTWTTAVFNASHELEVQDDDITLSQYSEYMVNGSFKLNDLSY